MTNFWDPNTPFQNRLKNNAGFVEFCIFVQIDGIPTVEQMTVEQMTVEQIWQSNLTVKFVQQSFVDQIFVEQICWSNLTVKCVRQRFVEQMTRFVQNQQTVEQMCSGVGFSGFVEQMSNWTVICSTVICSMARINKIVCQIWQTND